MGMLAYPYHVREETFLQKLALFLLLPFFTVGLLAILLLFIFPFYLIRSAISIYVRCSDLKVSRILTGLSASLLRDYDEQEKKPLSTIVVCLKGRGTTSRTKIREVFRSRVILKADHDDPTHLQFPELQQYYKVFMGYVFLMWDRKFDLDNHITQLKPGKVPLEKEDILKIWEGLMVKPFPKDRSPWELVFIDNGPPVGDLLEEEGEDDRETILFLRIHHGIADGFSVQRLLLSLDNDQRSFSDPAFHITNYEQFLLTCRTLIRGPHDLLKSMLYQREPDHTFHLPRKDLSKEYFITETESFRTQDVKRARKHIGVGFTSVLASAVCGGIQRFLERKGRPFPTLMKIGIPYATKGGYSNYRLENDFLIAPFEIPIEIFSPRERTMAIHRSLQDLAKSALPQMLVWVINALSCLPIDLMRSLEKRALFSTAYSTLPGPSKTIYGPEWRLTDVNFTYGTGAASLGICFSTITYLGTFKFVMFADKKLMGSRKNAEDMVKYVQEEFQYLIKIRNTQ